MLVWIFMFTIVFVILSAPLTAIFDGFDNSRGEHADEMDIYLPIIKTCLTIFFSIIIVTPIVGFIMWVYHREPDWGVKRY